MSILLESLNQNKQSVEASQHGAVPSVNDSHFDDEMLNDESLQSQLKVWKIISSLLVILLLVSWGGFYLFSVQPLTSIPSQTENSSFSQLESSEKERQEVSESEIEITPNKQITKNNENKTNNASQVENVYQPKKIAGFKSKNIKNENTNDTIISRKNVPKKNQVAEVDVNQAVEFESLTALEKSTMPELEISSYAISNNAEKSFVVLNGAFYGQGETIAPHLTLLSINKDSILIRYKDQLIRKKYSH